MQILEIALNADNLVSIEQFYSDTMGFETLYKTNTDISFRAGNSVLSFSKSEKAIKPYHFAFNIPQNRTQQALSWVKEKGIRIIDSFSKREIIDFSDWRALSFYFSDSEGNILEFIARSSQMKSTADEFDVSQVLCISEIGIPVEQVLQESLRVSNELGLAVFKLQEPTDSFTVLGDDNGLLIYVESGRKWFPTQIQAEPQNLKIRLLHENKEHCLNY